jgi:methylamine---glutamate N-methyltransferase subunit C
MSKKKPIIKTSNNGPLIVTGLDSITESVGTNVNIDDPAVALCRCGKSKQKPYCDGTHGNLGWTDEKQDGRQPRKIDNYVGKEIVIHDNRGICAHIGNCTDGLPKVFRMRQEPWIDADGETVEKIIKTIESCPSGALSYSIDGVLHNTFSKDSDVVITEDGPYYIKGSIELEDKDIPESPEHYALCRCGQSKNKPFCDGAHWYEKFKDDGKIHREDGTGHQDEAKHITHKKEAFDNKLDIIQHLAKTGKSANSAMRTLEGFPDWKTILFRGAQLHQMPLNADIPVNTKTIIGKIAKHPLELNMPFYVSHMSFGALSREAKIALAKGTAATGTAMCSGEGGMLPDEREAATKYIYELGTAAFSHDESIILQADAVELKIGQAVKPGLGGHLPVEKITPEIAKIRGLAEGESSISPGRLTGVNTVDDLRKKVARIREITDGKPVGIKFAAGHIEEDIAFALKAYPDFITIDCRGGATGSSPQFLKDNVGIPPIFAIRRARKVLDTLKSDVTLCITGGFRDSSDIAKGLALGADAIALATSSMIAIGCIQSKVCHTGTCPVGIATQDKDLRALFSEEKAVKQFQNFYNATQKELEVFARSNGKDDIHKLSLDDVVTLSNDVSMNTDIAHA